MLWDFTPCHLLCRHGLATQMCGIIGLFTHEVCCEPQGLKHCIAPQSRYMSDCAWATSVCLRHTLASLSSQSAVTLTALKASSCVRTPHVL